MEPSQAWGVSAAAPKGEVALKNGWLPAEVHDGLWTVNSVGRLVVRGHELLIAVLSERSPAMGNGVATVERMARLAVRTLVRAGAGVEARRPDGVEAQRPDGVEAQRPEGVGV
uniref:Secreted protein n=1 Tax=Nonomuraea gerenzanensis TaxID=93944 RepID=A0A1M4ELE2_9ACTN|nr:secreted protein [Nonomuraea gerenzanensis]